MPKTSDQHRHWILLPAWPEQDRVAWMKETGPCHALDIPSYGQSLKPASLASVERAYGRYINFLDSIGQLDVREPPGDRVTPPRVAAYIRHLGEMRYRGQTPVLLISGLASTMRILAPNRDFRWIWRPNGTSIAERLRGDRVNFHIPKASDMYSWGHELMAYGDSMPEGRDRLVALRDGLMIAMLAARPIRRRTMWGSRIGKHLIRTGSEWWLILESEDMKNGRAVEFHLPRSLSPRLEEYVSHVRPQLLRGATTDWVWIAAFGRPLALTAVGLTIRKRAIEHFGIAFGPHRFRHAVGTSAPTEDPTHPGVAAAVLAVGAGMVEKHYNRAENHVAAGGLHGAVDLERSALEPLAVSLFAARKRSQRQVRRKP